MKKIIHITLLLCLICCFTKNKFAKNNDTTKISIADTAKQKKYIGPAEVMPSYPGGIGALMSYLNKNLKYPADAKQFKFEGKVIVKFYIDVDGSVKEPVILKDGVGGGADIESIRLVKSMPKWTPGTQLGKPVKVYYTLPITFKLQ